MRCMAAKVWYTYNDMTVCEDLQENGLRIYVDKPSFSYGSDAVRLCGFARLKKGERALDLGCGTGILAILLNGRTGACFTAVDIQSGMCELAARSVALNGQQAQIAVRCADLRTLCLAPGEKPYDAAVCNPPYFPGGTPSPDEQRRLSRHQDACTPYDVADCAARMLKRGGRLYLSYPVSLLAEVCAALVTADLQPKRLAITPGGKLALIEARRGAKAGLTLEILNAQEAVTLC